MQTEGAPYGRGSRTRGRPRPRRVGGGGASNAAASQDEVAVAAAAAARHPAPGRALPPPAGALRRPRIPGRDVARGAVVAAGRPSPWCSPGSRRRWCSRSCSDLYDRDENRLHRATLDEVPGLFQLAHASITLLAMLAQGLITDDGLSEVDILVIWVSLGRLLVLGSVAARELLIASRPGERCVLIGDPQTTADVAHKIDSRASTSRSRPRSRRRRSAGARDRRRRRRRGVHSDRRARGRPRVRHRVILASSSWPAEHLLHAVAGLMASGIKVSVCRAPPGSPRSHTRSISCRVWRCWG